MSLPAYAMNQANFPELYERVPIGPMFRPLAEDLLDRVHFATGNRLIDIACGTGIVARCAASQAAERNDRRRKRSRRKPIHARRCYRVRAELSRRDRGGIAKQHDLRTDGRTPV